MRDVLRFVCTAILEDDTHLSGDLIVGVSTQSDTAGLGQALQARRDIDAVVIDVTALDNDIAKINTYAQQDLALRRCARVSYRHGGLDCDSAFDGVDHAAELSQQAVLADIIGGKVVMCEQNGTSYDRIVATCLLAGQDIAALMVQRAAARDCPRYSGGAYAQFEDTRHLSLPIGEFCWP